MSGKWQSWKKWTGIALGLLLLADGALAGYLWQLNQQGPEEIRAQRNRLATQAKLLKARRRARREDPRLSAAGQEEL